MIRHCDIPSQTLKGGKSWKRLGRWGWLGRMAGNQLLSQTWLHLFFAPPASSHQGQGPTAKEHDTGARSSSRQSHAESAVARLCLSSLPLQLCKKTLVMSCGEMQDLCLSIHGTLQKENLGLRDVFHSALSLLGGLLLSFVFRERVSPILVFWWVVVFFFFSSRGRSNKSFQCRAGFVSRE